MSILDTERYGFLKKSKHATSEQLREHIIQCSKEFKTSWVHLGQALYSVWKGKLFHLWGYEKFEHYTQKEAGLRKELVIKLLKTYFFLEEEEPGYLTKEFGESRDATQVPSYEAVNVLRLAKLKREINEEDFLHLKSNVFEKGKDALSIKKDLTALIKDRKEVDPEKEREEKKDTAIRRVVSVMRVFKDDMETLKLIPDRLIKEVDELMKKLERQVG